MSERPKHPPVLLYHSIAELAATPEAGAFAPGRCVPVVLRPRAGRVRRPSGYGPVRRDAVLS